MSKAIDNLPAAQKKAMAIRPKAGGFPFVAETVSRNIWTLPAYQSRYLTDDGAVVTMGAPLVSGTADGPPFDRHALITALRTDQAGNSTFPKFLAVSWKAGVVRCDVDFSLRVVTYFGCNGEEYDGGYHGFEIP